MTKATEDVEDGQQQSMVAVAIDKDKGSQAALKWTVDHLVIKGQAVALIHVKDTHHHHKDSEEETRELFLPFRCFCMRKDVHCEDVVLEGPDVAKAVTDYVTHNALDKLVVGASSKSSFARFKSGDVSANISKGAPDFCTVYTIAKGKVTATRKAIRPPPMISPLRSHSNDNTQFSADSDSPSVSQRVMIDTPSSRFERMESIKSPFLRGSNTKSYTDLALMESDISFVTSGMPSTDKMLPSLYDDFDEAKMPRFSNTADMNFDAMRAPRRFAQIEQMGSRISNFSVDNGVSSWNSQTNTEDMEAEMRRLKIELSKTMDMYSTACREALTARQKAGELHRLKMEEEQRLHEAILAEEAARATAKKEKEKCKVAIEAAQAAQRIAELEAQKRKNVEKKALLEAAERKKALRAIPHNDIRYRRYTIEEIEIATDYFALNRKIGEGGYGPVFKGSLDHTPVAIKVLRPDAAQGRTQFQQEVSVLSCIRHPNMVLLMGACPDYGCLVYEYMANGSLEDRLFRRGDTPILPWQLRFRIAAEIATGLLFLHQSKPEPLVHRDLKPANILLDRNYVSKISDVGLARLVPASIADTVTQYRMTSTAGTLCYIDPEYQQSGMLGVKSDVYSLGIVLLQVITGKPPMGLTHYVSDAIQNGTFEKMLDPAVHDWPIDEALCLAKVALQCAELRRKDRPDLESVVLLELERLSEFADEHMHHHYHMVGGSGGPSPIHSQISTSAQEVISDGHNTQSESESPRSHSSFSSCPTS